MQSILLVDSQLFITRLVFPDSMEAILSQKKFQFLVYKDISIQPYLRFDNFSLKEIKLLFALSSNLNRATIILSKW